MDVSAFAHRSHLLTTVRGDVPDAYIDGLAAFCAEVPEIDRGYVCAVRIERAGAEPERRLSFCVKLRSPVSGPGDSHDVFERAFELLLRSRREIVQAVGFGVITDHAVNAWERNALCIYRAE